MTMSLMEASNRVLCMNEDLRGITDEQTKALHVLHKEIDAAIEKLYLVLPKDRADPIILNGFKVIVREAGGPGPN